MKNIKCLAVIVVVMLVLLCWQEPVYAQCAMCKAAAEANLREGGGDPRGLNAGILYILSLPYLVVGAIGFWWWRNRKKDVNA